MSNASKPASKKDLIDFVASAAGITKVAAAAAVDATLSGISELTFAHKGITIKGFGRFSARDYAAREIRGGIVAHTVQVPARTVLAFSAAPSQVVAK